LFGSKWFNETAVPIVANSPMKANQNKPKLAPRNAEVVAADFFAVKRLKSDAAVTQARLNAANVSAATPEDIRMLWGGCHVTMSWKETVLKTTTDSHITKMTTKTIPIRSIIWTDFSPTEILNKCKTLIIKIPTIRPNVPPGLPYSGQPNNSPKI